jgi:hypothetical protein
MEDTKARKHASAVFRYEDFTVNKASAVERIAGVLGMDIDVSSVVNAIPDASTADSGAAGYDRQTLLHGGHATHTAHGTWRTELDSDLLERIHAEFGWWFEENRYDNG